MELSDTIPARATGALITIMCLSALAACASGPQEAGGGTGTAASRPTEPSSFSTGRLVVVVVDQNGRLVDRAQVDVTSRGATNYRRTGVTNGGGSVSFDSVPQAVHVSINHPGGNFAEDFDVSSSGTSEMRAMVQIVETETPEPGAGQPGDF